MATTTVSSKFQVVLPKAVRQHDDLQPGQVLQPICLPDRIELLPLQPASALRGFLSGTNG